MKKILLSLLLLLALTCILSASVSCKSKNEITIENGYIIVNGEKTEYQVYKDPTVTIEDGFLTIDGVKTKYKVDTPDEIDIVDGYFVVNGVKTIYKVELECEHKWQTTTTAPTCTEGGYDVKHCDYCAKTVCVNHTAAAGHQYFTYTADDEYHWYVCLSCDEVIQKAYHTLDDEGICTVCQLPVSDTPGVLYDVSTDGTYAEVVGYNGTASKVKIAEEYNGLPVKNIYSKAFYQNQTITSVVIPDSVTSIGDYAFSECLCLTSLVIGNTVKSIGLYAFNNCQISSVVIPDSVTSIGDYAFCNSYNLTSLVIGNGVKSIGLYAFNNCQISSVVIPDSEIGRAHV